MEERELGLKIFFIQIFFSKQLNTAQFIEILFFIIF